MSEDLKVDGAVPKGSTPGSIWSRTVRGIPGLLVLVGLGALAVWGHGVGWRMPKFSQLMGRERSTTEDWCAEHGVPESQCVECNAELMPRQEYGWCKIHGIPNCPLEHPELAQLKTPPRITAEELERAQRALQFSKRAENNNQCKLYQ